MTLMQASAFGDRLPTLVEQEDATRLKQIMDLTRGHHGSYKFCFPSNKHDDPQVVHIDAALGDALRGFLEIVAKGQSVQIVPIQAELTTKQAAALLNVSRPFLIKLLEEKKINHRKVGRHRRVRADDLFAYKRQQDGTRRAVLDEMLAADVRDDLL